MKYVLWFLRIVVGVLFIFSGLVKANDPLGLSYKMKFVPEPKRGDILVRTAGAQVLVDSKSALYLKGTHLDYSHALVSGGFKFTNPNAKASCSCGESFSV